MFKKLFVTLSFVFCSSAFAENAIYKVVINGKIGALARFHALRGEGTSEPAVGVNGTILYDISGSDEISLKGALNSDGQFRWEESLYDRENGTEKITGILHGQFNDNGVVAEGLWEKPDGSKKLPLKMYRIAQQKDLVSTDGKASAGYPHFDRGSLAKLNEAIALKAQDDFAANEQFIKDLTKEFQDSAPSIPQDEIDRMIAYLFASTDCEVDLESSILVSLVCTQAAYSGGAHGNYNLFGRTYQIDSTDFGYIKPIHHIWDFIEASSNAKNTLAKEIVRSLKQKKASNVVDANETEVVKEFVSRLEKNEIEFTIVPAGVAFHFSPYDVASYAEGSFRVIVPNKKLAPFYRKDGVLAGRR